MAHGLACISGERLVVAVQVYRSRLPQPYRLAPPPPWRSRRARPLRHLPQSLELDSAAAGGAVVLGPPEERTRARAARLLLCRRRAFAFVGGG